jgi:hypothetical protein
MRLRHVAISVIIGDVIQPEAWDGNANPFLVHLRDGDSHGGDWPSLDVHAGEHPQFLAGASVGRGG